MEAARVCCEKEVRELVTKEVHHGIQTNRVHVPHLRQEGNEVYLYGQAPAGEMPEEAKRRAPFVDCES